MSQSRQDSSLNSATPDFIQFAHSSKTVGDMATNRASEDDTHNHIMKGKLEQGTGNRDLSEAQRIVDVLD